MPTITGMTDTIQPTDGDFAPALPEVKLQLHPPGDAARAVVVSNELATGHKAAGFVRHITFDVSGTRLEGNFRAGQSFGILAPGVDERGKPHKVRLYSIASPSSGEDGEGKVLATTVKRLIAEHWDSGELFLGLTSNYMCNLRAGDEVHLTGPAGKRFVLPENPGDYDYLFFATGTGIAPFRGMVADLIQAGVESRIVLVMGSPYRTDVPYQGHFLRLHEQHPQFHFLTALSRERQDDGSEPMYVQDRIRTNRDEFMPLLEGERTLVYICGLSGMEVGILQAMARMLPERVLGRYLEADAKAMSQIDNWQRRMIPREVRPTPRVFIEVY
jgi:ferredoxin--NADP+ reductase